MGRVVSVNVAAGAVESGRRGRPSGIDKRPTPSAVWVHDPGPKGSGSGLAGDLVADGRHHGGSSQAVYAYGREDLDVWERELGRALRSGVFGENLTTADVEVNSARIGERWRVGEQLVLQVTSPRIPCRTFARWMGEPHWAKRFVAANRPGAYLRVITPGHVRLGDRVEIVHRPDHDVSIALCFRATVSEFDLLDALRPAGDDLDPETRRLIERRQSIALDGPPEP